MRREDIANFLNKERKISPLAAASLLVVAGFVAGSLQLVAPQDTSRFAMNAASAPATGTQYDSPAPESCTEAIKAALGKEQGPQVQSIDRGQSGTVDACFGAVLKEGKKPSQNTADYQCVGRSGSVTITSDYTSGITKPDKSVPMGQCKVQVCSHPASPPGSVPIAPVCSQPKSFGAGQSVTPQSGGVPQPSPANPNGAIPSFPNPSPDGAPGTGQPGSPVPNAGTGECPGNPGCPGTETKPAVPNAADEIKNLGECPGSPGCPGNPATTNAGSGDCPGNPGCPGNPNTIPSGKDATGLTPNDAGGCPGSIGCPGNPSNLDTPGSCPGSPGCPGTTESTFGQSRGVELKPETPTDKGIVPGTDWAGGDEHCKSNPWTCTDSSGRLIGPGSDKPSAEDDMRQSERPGLRDAPTGDDDMRRAEDPKLREQPKLSAEDEMRKLETPGLRDAPTGDDDMRRAEDPKLREQPKVSAEDEMRKLERPALRDAPTGDDDMRRAEDPKLREQPKRSAEDDMRKSEDPKLREQPKPGTGPTTDPGGGGSGPGGGSGGGAGSGGGGLGSLGSLLSGLMKGLGAGSGQKQQAQTCPTNQQAYAQYQQQYNQQLQDYNYRMQQYNYQSENYGYGYSGSAPVPPTPCKPGSGAGQCPALGAQPAAASCPNGTWRQMTNVQSGSVCPVWQCVAGTAPTAQLTCNPSVADASTTIAISYTCGNAQSSTGFGFVTGGATAGATSTVMGEMPSGAGARNFVLRCENGNTTASAQCSVQFAKISIMLRAAPKVTRMGDATLIGWVTSGMESCTISSPDQPDFTDRNASNKRTSGLATSSPIVRTTDFYLNCKTLTGGSKQEVITVEAYTPGTVTASIENRTNVQRGGQATINWSFPDAPDGSAVALWLYSVEDEQTVALISGHRAKSGSLTWDIPMADEACDTSSSLVCGTDLIPGRSYQVLASLYTPVNANLGEYSGSSLPDPEFLDNPITRPFKVSQ